MIIGDVQLASQQTVAQPWSCGGAGDLKIGFPSKLVLD